MKCCSCVVYRSEFYALYHDFFWYVCVLHGLRKVFSAKKTAYVVNMYAKIETERLNFIRFNQKKLRSEEYIHLRDAINNDGNVNDVGKMIILPATYTGSPRHIHEYAQDAMWYVRHYGRPDLFITFTCNPQWIEIKDHLFDGQSPKARIFKLKLKSPMDFIIKSRFRRGTLLDVLYRMAEKKITSRANFYLVG